jgi:Protein of unknown function (DUF2786)
LSFGDDPKQKVWFVRYSDQAQSDLSFSAGGGSLTLAWCQFLFRPMNKDILDKIHKLLRLADRSRGATEHEAKVALSKAEELMTRHKIDSAMLRMARGSHDLPESEIKKDNVSLPKTLNPADLLILSLLQSQFNVRCVLGHSNGHTPVDILGTAEDVQYALYVFHFLRETFFRCWNEFKVTLREPNRKSYYRGLHDGLKAALIEGKKKAEAEASAEACRQYEIVLVDNAAALNRYVTETYGKLRKRSSRSNRVQSESYTAGKAKGSTLQINRALNGGEK